ncbi:MAG: alkaline phosphatase D family protein [Myxococcota bacterium]
MKLTRREWLARTGWLGVGTAVGPGLTWVSGCGDGGGEPPAPQFQHGVASGDPLPDAVILWTRVTTEEPGPVEVRWEVASDRGFATVVADGTVTTDATRDFTVKVDAVGLQPGRTYYYRFEALGGHSLVGRTRTASDAALDGFRFALLSCSNYARGFFHAYRRVAERLDLDAVVHVGDYIYESGNARPDRLEIPEPRRVVPDREIVTLDDYRRRYAHYRTDTDLQAAHQMHPFIVVWDDHETANNAWRDGAQNHQPDTEGAWEDRKTAAARAHSEWMPIRDQAEPLKMWRSFRFGDLVELTMLDTRIWGRDETTGTDTTLDIDDPDRTLLGEDQMAWLEERITTTPARWKLLGQQVMMGQLLLGEDPVNLDQWDGYPAARQRVFDVLATHAIDDVVVLTGDIHSSWANDLSPDPHDAALYDPATGAGSVAVELVTPSVTSPFPFDDPDGTLANAVKTLNPHVRYVDLKHHGYLVVDLTHERMQSDWYHLDGLAIGQGAESFARAFRAETGANHLVEAAEPTSGSSRGAAPAFVPPAPTHG